MPQLPTDSSPITSLTTTSWLRPTYTTKASLDIRVPFQDLNSLGTSHIYDAVAFFIAMLGCLSKGLDT